MTQPVTDRVDDQREDDLEDERNVGAEREGGASAEVEIRYFAAAAEAAGREEENVPRETAATLGALQDFLVERYGEPMQRVLDSGSFLVDGIARRDREYVLGQRVDVLPPFAGG